MEKIKHKSFPFNDREIRVWLLIPEKWSKKVDSPNYLTTLDKTVVESGDHMFHWTANE
jgi:hypothetical protein